VADLRDEEDAFVFDDFDVEVRFELRHLHHRD
jgi:hypothetical protein